MRAASMLAYIIVWAGRGVRLKEENTHTIGVTKETKTSPSFLVRNPHLGTRERNLKRIAFHRTEEPLVELFA